MSEAYKTHSNGLYFVTFSVMGWVDASYFDFMEKEVHKNKNFSFGNMIIILSFCIQIK